MNLNKRIDALLHSKNLPQINHRSSQKVSRIFTVESLDLTFQNGNKAIYERIKGGRGAVMALPFDGSYFYLTSEYAGGVNEYVLGLVKGKIDHNESPQEAVIREMQEEIGLSCKNVHLLKNRMLVAPGMLELTMYPFLCTDLYPCELTGDEPEPIDIIKLTPNEVKELIFDENSALIEGRSIAALTIALHKIGALS